MDSPSGWGIKAFVDDLELVTVGQSAIHPDVLMQKKVRYTIFSTEQKQFCYFDHSYLYVEQRC